MNVSIRPARPADIPAIAKTHHSAFPGFFLTLLGTRFLATFYRAFVDAPAALLLVAEQDPHGVVGFLAASGNPTGFFGALRRRRGVALGLAAVPALLRHPLRVSERLLAAVRYRGDDRKTLPGYWLLSSLGVCHEHAGKGVGGALVRALCEGAERAGAPGVYLVTDEDQNEAVQRFYEKLDFSTHETWRRRDGRRMRIMAREFAR